MKPDIIYRPKRPLYSAKVTSLPASAVSAEKAVPAKSATKRKSRQKPIPAVQSTEGPTSANSAPDGTLADSNEKGSGVLSEKSLAKITADVTAKAQAKSKPPSRSQDMKALRKRLKSILSKSEAKALDLLFERIDRQQAANRKGQAAWRERQRNAK